MLTLSYHHLSDAVQSYQVSHIPTKGKRCDFNTSYQADFTILPFISGSLNQALLLISRNWLSYSVRIYVRPSGKLAGSEPKQAIAAIQSWFLALIVSCE